MKTQNNQLNLSPYWQKRYEEMRGTFEAPPLSETATTSTRPTPAASQAAANDNTGPRLFIAGLDDVLRAMPNQVARSSLFAPVARGRRQYHRETPLVTRADAVMTYTGEQLDEADADLCLQLIFEARAHPLGQPVKLNRAALLRAMGRDTGKQQYDWLHRRMKALTAATLFIEAKRPDGSMKYRIGTTKAFHILADFDYDEATETYSYKLDPRWQTMFGNREYALLDWNKRLQIGRGQDMAKALQRLVATSSDPEQRYSLDWLKNKMQYTGRPRDFRAALIRAARELERLEIIAASEIETSTKGREQLNIRLMGSV